MQIRSRGTPPPTPARKPKVTKPTWTVKFPNMSEQSSDSIDITAITLTIAGYGLNFDEISEKLNLVAKRIEQWGEQNEEGQVPELDRWFCVLPVGPGMSQAARLRWLGRHLQSVSAFLHDLRARADIKVEYFVYTFRDTHEARFDPAALSPFIELDIPLDIKIRTRLMSKEEADEFMSTLLAGGP